MSSIITTGPKNTIDLPKRWSNKFYLNDIVILSYYCNDDKWIHTISKNGITNAFESNAYALFFIGDNDYIVAYFFKDPINDFSNGIIEVRDINGNILEQDSSSVKHMMDIDNRLIVTKGESGLPLVSEIKN